MLKSTLGVMVLGIATLGAVGCSKEASTTKETTVSTPEGETTVRETKSVEKSGENPPPAN